MVIFLDCVQLAVISATIRDDLTVLVSDGHTLHRPLAVDEAAVPYLQRWLDALIAFAAHRADELPELPLDRGHEVAAVYDDQLVRSPTLLVLAVAEPAQSILDLAIPRRFLLPIDLPDRLDRVERKVYS